MSQLARNREIMAQKSKKTQKSIERSNTHISANMGRIDLPDGPEDNPRPGEDHQRHKKTIGTAREARRCTNEGTRTPNLGIRSATRYHCATSACLKRHFEWKIDT